MDSLFCLDSPLTECFCQQQQQQQLQTVASRLPPSWAANGHAPPCPTSAHTAGRALHGAAACVSTCSSTQVRNSSTAKFAKRASHLRPTYCVTTWPTEDPAYSTAPSVRSASSSRRHSNATCWFIRVDPRNAGSEAKGKAGDNQVMGVYTSAQSALPASSLSPSWGVTGLCVFYPKT